MTIIRPATPSDAEALQRIYAPYVEHTAVSFELVPPTVEEFRARIINIGARYPYLVVEESNDNDNKAPILGYAYASAFHPRAALRHCAETSIYLAPEARGRGIGRQLYAALTERLLAMGITNLYASIAWIDAPDEYLTHQSADFHHHLGYTKVAHFHRCGYKFQRYYDLIWMEKILT